MRQRWSIGLYAGASPLRLSCAAGLEGGILHAADVTDARAEFVADPFMVRSGGAWSMFFEVFDAARRLGSIGLAQSPDLRRWRYRGIVVEEPFHLSYPHVFEAGGSFYMAAESLGRGGVSLYRADRFPSAWSFAGLLAPGALADPSIVRHGGRWWLFACATPHAHDVLRLFSADALDGPWAEHPLSPLVVGDARRARPAGRVIPWRGGLLRFAQDCGPAYGSNVRAFAVGRLTDRDYEERGAPPDPLLRPGAEAWNRGGLHHVDAHRLAPGRWVACVDGWSLVEG